MSSHIFAFELWMIVFAKSDRVKVSPRRKERMRLQKCLTREYRVAKNKTAYLESLIDFLKDTTCSNVVNMPVSTAKTVSPVFTWIPAIFYQNLKKDLRRKIILQSKQIIISTHEFWIGQMDMTRQKRWPCFSFFLVARSFWRDHFSYRQWAETSDCQREKKKRKTWPVNIQNSVSLSRLWICLDIPFASPNLRGFFALFPATHKSLRLRKWKKLANPVIH